MPEDADRSRTVAGDFTEWTAAGEEAVVSLDHAEFTDALRALWVDTVHRSREALAEALSRGGLEPTAPHGMSLRRVIAYMIKQYARHTGHADLLREQVDGAIGEGPPLDFPAP